MAQLIERNQKRISDGTRAAMPPLNMNTPLTRLSSFLLVSVLVGLAGCTMQHSEPADFTAEVAVAGLTLAEECGSGRLSDPGFAAGDCAPEATDCSLPCTQSNITLLLTADADRPLSFEIVRATLINSEGLELMELSTHNPQSYDGVSSYAAWDETVPTPTEGMNLMYDLSGVDWSGVDEPWSATYKVRLTIEIDGETFTATSTETARQAPIVT